MADKHQVPKAGDLIIFSKIVPRTSVTLQWTEKQDHKDPKTNKLLSSKTVTRKEVYHVVRCHWIHREEKTSQLNHGIGGVVSLFVANNLIAPEYHYIAEKQEVKEEVAMFKPFLGDRKHVASFPKVGLSGMVTATLDQNFFFGQNTKQTKRFLVYHPESWSPKQCHFVSSGNLSLAFEDFISPALGIAKDAGLGMFPGAPFAADMVAKTGVFQAVGRRLYQLARNSFGHPLHKFNKEEERVKSDQEAKVELKLEDDLEKDQRAKLPAALAAEKIDPVLEEQIDEMFCFITGEERTDIKIPNTSNAKGGNRITSKL